MSGKAAFVWDEGFTSYSFGPEHPMQPIRLKMTYELARMCGVLDGVEVVKPSPATRAELELIHDPDYIDDVERISREADDPYKPYGRGLGTSDNPAVPGMHDVSALIAGGSIAAASKVWNGEVAHAFNHAGGLHHAMADRASGFCIYNDASIAIEWLKRQGAQRILYVDVDVHHGDGVQDAFYSDPAVMTISLHETGYFLFPGTGFPHENGAGAAIGTSVNVALPPYTHDAAYRESFERVVPALAESFKPDVLVTQLGCDTHATDPLAHLALTTQTYRWIARTFHDLAHRVTAGRWVALGGGGYQRFSVVPRAWTIYAAEQSGTELPAEIPREWMYLATKHGASKLFGSFDDPEVQLPEGSAEEATLRARKATDETIDHVFPHHGLKP